MVWDQGEYIDLVEFSPFADFIDHDGTFHNLSLPLASQYLFDIAHDLVFHRRCLILDQPVFSDPELAGKNQHVRL